MEALKAQQARLRADVAAKEALAAKNRARRKDKDTMIAQLTKATAENEAQLAELQAVADELIAELDETESKISISNAHIGELLKPAQPPQSQTLRLARKPLTEEQKEHIKERSFNAAEQHRINLMHD